MRPNRGPTILFLGILSLVICPFFGPVVWIMANRDLEDMDRGVIEGGGRGLTWTGKIIGGLGTAVWSVVVIAWLVMTFRP